MALTLLLAMLVSATAANAQSATLGGAATFRTAQGSTPGSSNSVVVNLTGLASLGSAFRYEGWLVKSNGEKISIGTFSGPNATRTWKSPTNENLAATYVQMLLTREPFPDPDPATAGPVQYSGTFKSTILGPYRVILAKSTVTATGNGVGQAAYGQSKVAQAHAVLAQNSTTLGDMQTHAQHVINVVDGLGAPGDGIGVITYANEVKAQANKAKAAADPNTEKAVITNADKVIAAADDLINRANTAKSNAQSLIDATTTGLLTDVYIFNLVSSANAMVNASQNVLKSTQDMGAFKFVAGEAPPPPSAGDATVPMIAMSVLLAGLVLTAGGFVMLRRRQGAAVA